MTSPAMPVVEGPVVALDEPLSFWGGFAASTGRVIDAHHAQHGVVLSGAIVVMPAGRGSSSASSVLVESVRLRTAPAAIVTERADPILTIASIVADELYDVTFPVIADPVLCAELRDQLWASVPR